MAVNVKIPTPLRKFTDGADVVPVEATTIREVLDALEAADRHAKILIDPTLTGAEVRPR